MIKNKTWDVFCKIIDNYGDIGVSYRLSKNLVELNQIVRMFVSELHPFKKIEPRIDTSKCEQIIDNIQIILWDNSACSVSILDSIVPSDIIIEMFACNLPDNYIFHITDKSIWINLEYLSAEDWVEECHEKMSFSNGHFKYFFFPGFTDKTGGLNFEQNLITKQSQGKQIIETKYGIDKIVSRNTLCCSIFCYENKTILSLLANVDENIIFIVPEGVFSAYLMRYSELYRITVLDGSLMVNQFGVYIKIIPMTNQHDYDQLLISCDLNIVRGEDSFVRAQILSTPFFWNIYQQIDNAHLKKLDDFLEKYKVCVDDDQLFESLVYISNSLNTPTYEYDNSIFYKVHFINILQNLEKLQNSATRWQNRIMKIGTLARNLILFAQSREK